jgi:subtilase family serine protease
MAHKKSIGLPLAVLLLSSLGAAVGQAPASRINGDWRSSDAVTIPASVPPAVTSSVVVGAAPSGAQLERMILLLEPSAAQQQALATELSNQQDSTSPEYRHWLTPSAFAAAYSNSSADVATVADWLRSQGFRVAPLPAGLGWIEFSGTVGQLELAFHTQVKSVVTATGTASCWPPASPCPPRSSR